MPSRSALRNAEIICSGWGGWGGLEQGRALMPLSWTNGVDENNTAGAVMLRGKAELSPQDPREESEQIKGKEEILGFSSLHGFPGNCSLAKGQYRESQPMRIWFIGIQLCVPGCAGLGKVKREGRGKKVEKGVEKQRGRNRNRQTCKF